MRWSKDTVRVENVPVSPVPDAATATTVMEASRLGSVLANANAAVVTLHVYVSDVRT